MARVLLAFLLAPLVGIVLGEVLWTALWIQRLPDFGLVTFGLVASYPLLLSVGIPVFLGLRVAGKLSFFTVLLSALFIGVLGTALILRSSAFHPGTDAVVAWSYALASALCGGVAFWTLGVKSNPGLPRKRTAPDGSNGPA